MANNSEEGSRLLSVAKFTSSRSQISLGCVQSKAAGFILLWNFSVLLFYRTINNATTLFEVDDNRSMIVPVMISFFLSVVAVLSPIAGLLTDVKFSRYEVCYSHFMCNHD